MMEFEKTLRDALDKGVTFSSICRDIIDDCKELERIEVGRAIAGANKVPNATGAERRPEGGTETRMKAEHIHTPEDGRGPRDVFVDGKLVDRVFFADTRRGIVRAYKYPLRLDKWRKRVLSETMHGVVEVLAKVGAGETAPEGHNA